MLRHDAPEYYYHTRMRRGPSGLHNTWLILGGEAFDNHSVAGGKPVADADRHQRTAAAPGAAEHAAGYGGENHLGNIGVRNLCAPTLPCYPPDRDRFTGGC
jgi:type VI secretion system protein ImpG